jgi:hypothetical protein
MRMSQYQEKVKCFGGKAALTCEATFVSRDNRQVPTINLEVAPKEGQAFNWSRKITVQLGEQELPLLCALFLGFVPSLKIAREDKGIEVIRQDKNIFLKATGAKRGLFAMPILPGDSFVLGAFLLKRLTLQTGLQGDLLLAAIKSAGKLHVNSLAPQQKQA